MTKAGAARVSILPDQLWALTLFVRIHLSSPPSLPQKHVYRFFIGFWIIYVFQKDLLSLLNRTGLRPIRWRECISHHGGSQLCPKTSRAPSWDASLHSVGFLPVPSSPSGRISGRVLLTRKLIVRLGGRIWRIPPQDVSYWNGFSRSDSREIVLSFFHLNQDCGS